VRVPDAWGASSAEVAAATPADDLVAAPMARWVRAVSSSAAPSTMWRWVCQLTVAPYSYDRIDNGGRTSPRTLTPGADALVIGQRLLVLFVIDSFADGEHLTLRRGRPGRRGPAREFAITYRVRRDGPGSRLVATVVLGGDPGPLAGVLRRALAWGDLIMMRRQLRTLASLAAG
jgi:hypothetical protein